MADGDCTHEIKRCFLLRRKARTNQDSVLKSREITLLTIVKAIVSLVVMYGCESWITKKDECWRTELKNWCFWTVVLEKTLESPLDCKEIKPVDPKRNKCWIFTGRTGAKAEAPTLWPPDSKNWLIGKDPDTGNDWRQEAKGTTEDEVVEWHHRLYGHELEEASGVGDRQGSLACCSPWGHKVLDTTEQLNWWWDPHGKKVVEAFNLLPGGNETII